MHRHWIHTLPCLAVLAAAAAPCLAQFSGTVQGSVTDATGAAVPNAAVVLHSADTGSDLRSTTSSAGVYTFNSVAPGDYTVTVEGAGFGRAATHFTLSTSEIRGINVVLRPAAASQNVEVTANAAALNLEETRVQTTLTADSLKSLPLPNRDTTLLIQLAPGASGFVDETNGIGYGSSIFGNGVYQPGGGTPIVANGLPGEANLYLLDDLPVMSTTTKGSVTILPNPDMIDQVSLQTQTYSVENGQSGSLQTAFTTKSGANKFHGSADFTYTGRFLTASQEFSPSTLNFHRQNFIGSLGGPVWKDHTFFFGSVQLLRAAGAGGGLDTWIAPEAAAFARTAFPAANAPRMLLLAPPTRTYNGTPILASKLYPYTPAADGNTASGCGSAAAGFLPCDLPVLYSGQESQSNPYNGTQWNVRLDQLFRGGNDRLYGQYIHLDQTQGYLSDRPFFDSVTPSDNWYWSVNYVHVFNARLVNEAHFGAARSGSGTSAVTPVSQASAPVFPVIFDGGNVQTTFNGTRAREHTLNFRDTVSWNLGAHNLRVGYQFFRGDSLSADDSYARPFVPLFFTALNFLQDIAYEAGYYSIGGNGTYQPQVYGSAVNWNGIFIDDQWKVRPNLTLNFGLRYDDFGNPAKSGSGALNFYPLFLGAGSTLVDRVIGVHTALSSNAFSGSQNFNFQPRGGFAWSPAADHRLLLRGGMGLYDDAPTPFQIASNLPTSPPNRISLSPNIFQPAYKAFLDPLPYGDFKTPTAPYGVTLPTVPTYGVDPSGNIYSSPDHSSVYASGLNGYDRGLGVQKSLNYSLGMDLEGPARLVYSMMYVGSHGYDLYYGGDYNLLPGDLILHKSQQRRTSEWGQIIFNRNGLSSGYNGLVVSVRQNWRTLYWQSSYSWSHALQDAPLAGQGNSNVTQLFANVASPKQYYGNAPFDRTNVFSLAGGYEVPNISTNPLLNQSLAHWRVGTIVTAQSGTPFTVVNSAAFAAPTAAAPLGGDYQADGNNFGIPTYTGNHAGGWSRDLARKGVFNLAQDFAAPANYTQAPTEGAQGVNSFRNPGYFVVDANLSKGFQVPWFQGEHATFLLRGEASNLLNRANLGSLGNDTNSQYFGQSSVGLAPRFLQLGGRLEF